MHRKIGLVLDGGGAKGAYQIGVWKAMRETGIDRYIKCVAGSSVGGLNAALFVQDDYEKAEDIWLHKLSNLQSFGVMRLQMFVDELLSNPEIIDMSVFRNSPVDCYMATYCPERSETGSIRFETINNKIRKYTDGKVDYFNMRNCDETECSEIIRRCSICKSIMLATSALPFLCKAHKIDGEYHRDGGLKDNSPVKPLVFAEKCNTVFVIHLKAEVSIDKKQFPDSRIYEIIPSKDLGGFFSGTINFKSHHITMIMEAGYNDSIGLMRSIARGFHQQEKAERLHQAEIESQEQQYLNALKRIELIDSVLDK